MQPAAIDVRTARVATWVNLVLPGGGLVWIGSIWTGMLIGLVFVVSANLALVATLLIPADFGRWLQMLIIGFALGSYFAAQVRLAQDLRAMAEAAAREARREALRAAREHLLAGDVLAALEALRPVADRANHDLLVAYRLAQALSGSGDGDAAREAWQRVRKLDTHGIYRDEIREQLH